ncbi:MAG: Uma2 family endonuclease [Anaerolineae bacterium]|nr:Uma2 family endonuclease [Anaerolineae bacterium]
MAWKAISTKALPLRQWPAPGEWTYADYRDLPDDGYIYEVIDGELYMTPAPNIGHQQISRNLEYLIWQFVKTQNLGEVLYAPCDVVLPGGTPVQPDILFVKQARLTIITEQAVEGAPDLIIEILSPSNSNFDRVDKYALYERAGVPEFWIVDPDKKTIEVFALQEGNFTQIDAAQAGGSVASKMLPGFSVAVDEVMP